MILAQKELFATENSDRFISPQFKAFRRNNLSLVVKFLNHPPTPRTKGMGLAHSNALHTVLPMEGDVSFEVDLHERTPRFVTG